MTKSTKISVYMDEATKKRCHELARSLTDEGIIEPDQRGYPSVSAMLRHLVAREEERREATPSEHQ